MYIRTDVGLGNSPDISSTTSTTTGSIFQQIQNALASGQWYLALTLSILTGLRDENKLTNMIFFARHRERGGRKLEKGEPNYTGLSQEWLDIRNSIVRPMLLQTKEAKGQASTVRKQEKSKPSPSSPILPSQKNDKFSLKEWNLQTKKIVVASAGNEKKGTAVKIVEAPSVFLPEIIGMARDLALQHKKEQLADKLDPATWYKEFTRITFLGRLLKKDQYVHIEMARLLKAIEREMVKKYGGDATSVGNMLLNNSEEGISGSRMVSSTATFSMHMFGLAIDVNYKGNPYIQEEKVIQKKKVKPVEMLNKVLSNAARLMNRPTIVYKKKAGLDNIQEMDTLLEKYFSLLDDPVELELIVKGTSSPDWRGSSEVTARRNIQKDLDALAPLLARGGELKDYFKKHGILNFDKRFVVQMEDLGLHWGGEYGDMMHFDMRKTGVGYYIGIARLKYKRRVIKLAQDYFKQKRYGTYPVTR
jgi:hypothetical protein